MNICCSDCFNPKRDTFHRFIKENGFEQEKPVLTARVRRGSR